MILLRNILNHKTTIQYETILWDPDDELIFESSLTDYDHEYEAKNVLDLGVLEDLSDSETYYDESNSKQINITPTPKNHMRKHSPLPADDSDSYSSSLSSSSYFTPLPPEEDTKEKTNIETVKQTTAPSLQTPYEDGGNDEVQVLSPIQENPPKMKTQSEPPFLQQSLTQSASFKYHHNAPKSQSSPLHQQNNTVKSEEKQSNDNRTIATEDDNDLKSEKILDQITNLEPNSKSDGHGHPSQQQQPQHPQKKVAFNTNDLSLDSKDSEQLNHTKKTKVGFMNEASVSMSEHYHYQLWQKPPKILSNIKSDELLPAYDAQPSPQIMITESTDSISKPISSTMNEFKRKRHSSKGRKARKSRSRKSSAQKEKQIRRKSRAAKGTIPAPKIPDIVIEEADGVTLLPVKMVHLFARVRTHHKLHNYKNMNYASKSYQQDPKLVNSILDQQIAASGECKISDGVYAFVKKNIGTQKEYKLALRMNSDDINHATEMLNFVQSKLDESLEKIKKITKFNHDVCIQSIISEMNKK